MEATNGKSHSYATCNVTIKLGEIPAISIVRKKNAPEKIHPFKQFVVRGKILLIKMLYRIHILISYWISRLEMHTLILLIVFSSSYWAGGDLHSMGNLKRSRLSDVGSHKTWSEKKMFRKGYQSQEIHPKN